MGGSSSRGILVGILLAIGCFSESPTEATCRDGEVGCPCGIGCDAGLVCADDVALCIPEDCVPGSELCTCNDGQCLAGLECTGGLCREPDGTGSHSVDGSGSADDVASTQGTLTDPSTTGADTAEPTTPTTTDPSLTDDSSFTSDPSLTDTMTGPTPTDPSMTSSEPTTDTVTDSDATESETGMIDGEACQACTIEANGMGGNCEMAVTNCAGNFGCTELANCVSGCLAADDPGCIADCCVANPGGVADYAPLADCHTIYCGQMCAGFDLQCGGG